MKSKEKKDVIPYYCTLPMMTPEYKTEEGKVTIPMDSEVRETRRWSEELKL
ncbi:MAG: hypothetical protein IJ333_08090 [Clostridia bacterium]|nr:hypothetical protein [Clostridia bacterium]